MEPSKKKRLSKNKKYSPPPRRWGLPPERPSVEVNDDILDAALNLLNPPPEVRKSAGEEVTGAAKWYLFWNYAIDKAPRPTAVAARLAELSEAANKLHKQIHDLDLFSLHRLAPLFENPIILRMLDTQTGELRRLEQDQESVLLALTKAIEQAADKALDTIETGQGGNGAGYSAKDELAGYCLDIFNSYRPGEYSYARNGDFSTFVNFVYELATGKECHIVRPVERACENWKAFPNLS